MPRLLRRALALGALTTLVSIAQAQTYRDTSGTVPQPVVPLVGCSPGGSCSGPVSATNPMPISGSFSATISGFAPGSAYATPLSVSTTSARVALPTGTVVVVYNTGANAAYVQLGNSSVTATASNDVIQPGSWMAFTVGSNTNLAAITSSGATSLNISGGSGLPTGAGGGGSSGGGGTVTQGTAASAAGAWPTYLTQGGSALSASNGIFVNPATGATFAVSGSVTLGAGSNTIGNVGGLGTAGTPSGGVVSVQGVAGGVAQPVSQSAGPWTENQTQLGGATLGAATAWGTAPSGNVQGVNADILGPLGSSTADGAALATTLAGTGVTGFTLPSGCTGAVGSIGYWQCLITISQSSLPAGTNIVGKFGIDQTTPGTTNKVAIDQTTNGTTNNVQATPPANVTPNDCSGTITAGGTAQVLLSAQTTLHEITIANIDPNTNGGEPLWISFTGTAAVATQGSYPIPAPNSSYQGMGSWTSPPGAGFNHAFSIIAGSSSASNGHKFSCSWW